MEPLLRVLRELEEYRTLCAAAEADECAAITGLSPLTRAHMIAALSGDLGKPLLAVCADEGAAHTLQEALASFLPQEPPLLPDRDLNFYDASAMSRGWEQKRLGCLYQMAVQPPPVVVASLHALTLRTIPRAALTAAALTLSCGDSFETGALAARLTELGYSRCSMVEGRGQFALRGDILDAYPPDAAQPVRVEFFGDEIDTMGCFDPVTQRRTENIETITLLPVAETLPVFHPEGTAGLEAALTKLLGRVERRRNSEALQKTLRADLERLHSGLSFAAWDRYQALIYPEFACAADYLPENSAVVFCDHGALQKTARAMEEELRLSVQALLESGMLEGGLCKFQLPWEQLCARFDGHALLYLDSFLSARYPSARPPKELLSVTAKQLPSYSGNLDTAVSDLTFYQKNGFRTLVLCGGRHRGEILQGLLREKHVDSMLAFPLAKLPQPGQILLAGGSLPAGVEYPELHLAVLTEGQITTSAQKKRRTTPKTKATNRKKLSSFTDLTPGDLVVHEHHGIGRYVCMEQMKVDGVRKDYVKIAYSGADVLYVPATQLDLISKYIGGGSEDAPVKLNRLSGDAWQKTKARAKKAAQDLAAGLIQLYAQRRRLPGFAFSPDSPWQQEFEDSFAYAETDDQLRCIAEIKSDMEEKMPMDRLLCGDVGFGKTEVALRAAMKAMLDGKQVAILVPTTVLAQQHYLTAVRRFRGFPVNIDVLSRFRTPAQHRSTLSRLAGGHIDLIIGTHKLLQKDVQFKDLGLLIVDEEQRFGVTHKERLKEMSRGVDVLTLSATPIPRTLNMALSGIRDMSTIEEPPSDRYPVQTFVLEYDPGVLTNAMTRELQRGGQVYYLHNRVETIEQTAAAIKKQIPDAEIAVAHGKMSEEGLSDVMQKMADGEIQILVCTTIIETGIDIPNVNTLIIEDADRLGLSQLHQLRGRVGRSSRHAYAYLTYRRGKVLSEIAEKRLAAIRDFAEFGSGFKIAMRDLEIRGAGNLLGPEQSGHLMSVGYDMYLKLLEEAVLEERGETPARSTECAADLTIEASIDRRYVENGEQRMDLYRRIAAIRGQEDADDVLDELLDRYGEPPLGVRNLISVALLRAKAARCGISDITQRQEELGFTLATLDFAAVSALCADTALRNRVRFSAGAEPLLTYRLRKGEDALHTAHTFLDAYGAMLGTA